MEKLRPEFANLVKDCGFEVSEWRDDILPETYYFHRILISFLFTCSKLPDMKEKIKKLFTEENYIKYKEEFNYFGIGRTSAYDIIIGYENVRSCWYKAKDRNSIIIFHGGEHESNRHVILFNDAGCEIGTKQAAKCYDNSKLRVIRQGGCFNWKQLYDNTTGYIQGGRYRIYDKALVFSRGTDMEIQSKDVVVYCNNVSTHYIWVYSSELPQILHEPGADVNIRKCD
jgi:hypothetical protein